MDEEVNPQEMQEIAQGGAKFIWTPAMEKSALELYVKAVEVGKRVEAGFKPEVHQWVASKLQKEFPGMEFNDKKVKSKLSQLRHHFSFFFIMIYVTDISNIHRPSRKGKMPSQHAKRRAALDGTRPSGWLPQQRKYGICSLSRTQQ
jgi:hypothetical protein